MKHKIVTIIPARGGSKGIPGKNIIDFLGKPLIAHSIEYSIKCDLISQTYVSTDDDIIAEVSTKFGAKLIQRPKSLATDSATTESAIEHALNTFDFQPDIIVLLQATSPFRPVNSLKQAIEKFIRNEYDSLLSISPTHRFFWKISDDETFAQYDFMNRPRRQDLKKNEMTYVENGSVYIFTRKHFEQSNNRLGRKIGHIIFSEEYSYEIDTLADLEFLKILAKQN